MCVCVMCVCTDLEFKSLGVANMHSWNRFDVLSQLCGNLVTRALEIGVGTSLIKHSLLHVLWRMTLPMQTLELQ